MDRVDERPVALLCGNAPGTSVLLRDVAFRFQHAHVIAYRR